MEPVGNGEIQSPAKRVAATQFELLSRLAEAGTPREVATTIVRLARAQPQCESAIVAWALDAEGGPQSEPATQLGRDQLELMHSATTRAQPAFSADGCRVAIRLFDTHPAILLLTAATSPGALHLVAEMSAQLKLAGRHMCRALESAELQTSLQRLERSESLQRALFAISDLAGSDRDMPDVLRGIHAIVGTLMYAENFFIVLHDAERDTLRFLHYVDAEDPLPPGENLEIPMNSLERSLTWYLLRDAKPLMGSTPELITQLSGPLALIGPEGYDWLGVPMLRDGRAQGAIVVQSYREDMGYSIDDRTLLEFVAEHILTALERKQGKQDLEQRVRVRTVELADANQVLQLEIVERQRAERLQAALFQIAQLATADISQTEFYRCVHGVVGELINAQNFFIGLLSEDGIALEFPYYVDAEERIFPSRPLAQGLSEYVINSGKAFCGTTEDIRGLEHRGDIVPHRIGSPAVCWLGVPLTVGEDTIGLIVVQSYDTAIVYGPADQELLSFVASQIANSLQRRRSAETLQLAYAQLELRVQERTQDLSKEILERERIQEQLKHQVMHDALTGLPNRSYLRDRLERVLWRLKREPTRHCALLYLDVDRFKIINDSLGHLAGDDVLKEVARRLQTCVREPDVVARLSGDEFAILLEDVPVPATAVKVAQRVLAALGEPLQVGSAIIQPSASVGIAVGDGRYQLADEVLRDADTAMYRAKKLGRKRFELFDESLQKSAVDVLATEGELRTALIQDQFEPYFQPIVQLATGEVVGYEALLRWNHPTRGVIGPPEFLQIAEDSGSIEAIDWRMFEISCRLAARLDPEHERAFLTINVSPLHFRRADFDSRLLALLKRTGLAPERLLIEITEGSLIEHPQAVRTTLDRLQAAGIGASLDDFGTGYSSLSYLHTFPLQVLKIDRSFVIGLDPDAQNSSAKVVAAVIAMARALDMQVVAEGIETDEQRSALMALGCELGQGYLLGRPAPVSHWPAGASTRG